ncbi:phenylacetate--CoA ligase family protein [Romboutsia ilealis]|uniref:Phenylacetate--CoA ligase family protein n=1 Tax=Romboutsia faecis TaxID=2764597 RepID=A0ABR7JLL0_9FIRM|nr:phenylacetate--CoA ligase family protein [Romboutsia faecis]MBC5995807.1 phenylacetate--CoA ligase family protein [Romboutsia faecis]MRN23006.1 phenylacetate--CoA ligase family protein [Romboutsia ilealis]
MKIDESIRRYGFWIKDYLKGKKIYNHYKDIEKNYLEGVNQKDIEKKVKKLLEHASETTNFYSKYKGVYTIDKFPVVNKMNYKMEYNKFISEKYKNSNTNRNMSTSGSTGTPFTIIQDESKIKRCHAAVIFFGEMVGYKIGMKQAAFRIWTEKVRKTPLDAYKQNLVMVDISDMNDKRLEKILDDISKNNVKSILAYASALNTISEYMTKKGIKINNNVESIISCAEMLYHDTQANLRERFNCPVVSRYVNMENGIMGQQYNNNNIYYIDSSSYHIEILKLDSDEPADYGELGRIVITDLYNYAFPVIRYDTGDTGILEKINDRGKDHIVLKELYGRRVDIIYNSKGEPISPHVITNNMWGIEGINQFKFIQEDKKLYKILINSRREFDNFEDISDKFRNILGMDVKIEIERVDEIPVLESGKRKYIENLCEIYIS